MIGTMIDEVSCHGERLCPKLQWSCTVNYYSAKTVVKGLKNTLGLVVLLRRIGAGQPELNTMS